VGVFERLDQDLLRLSVDRSAKGVWLSASQALIWSDNMLNLLPGLGQSEVRVRWLDSIQALVLADEGKE